MTPLLRYIGLAAVLAPVILLAEAFADPAVRLQQEITRTQNTYNETLAEHSRAVAIMSARRGKLESAETALGLRKQAMDSVLEQLRKVQAFVRERPDVSAEKERAAYAAAKEAHAQAQRDLDDSKEQYARAEGEVAALSSSLQSHKAALENLKRQLQAARFEKLQAEVAREKRVTARGEFGCEDATVRACREGALAHAKRSAVERGSALLLKAVTLVEDMQLTRERIESHVQGILVSHKVLDKGWVGETSYFYEIEAVVKGRLPENFFDAADSDAMPVPPEPARNADGAASEYRIAAEQGDAEAQHNLALMYYNGKGVPRDYKQAETWFRLAAEQGNASAQSNLGVMYANGEGVPRDYKQAAMWSRLAAEQGNAFAQDNLGFMYLHGKGVPRDYKQAETWFRLAAEQEYASAQNNLGSMYYNGQGVPIDYKQAATWFRLATEQGNAYAQGNLGLIYLHGQGVPRDYKQAETWFRLAAEQGDASAQNNLGRMYDNGKGVPRDYKQAETWFRLAAEQGNAYAQNNLGSMYLHGKGVPRDYKQAAMWSRLAAEQGNASAQSRLGGMYANGEGVPRDFVYAHMWSNLAASSGDEAASAERDDYARQMTPSQLEKAQDLARECVRKDYKGC